ncbi:MAG: nitroreductase family protein, partial [Desulfotomaculaceae bacterium]|nr:nitroreductase family protein [Desulfotomaculaceae bacterium]
LSGIINTASFAPTAGNLQSVNWLVIEETVEISFLAGLVIDWMRQVIKEEPEMAESMHMKLLVADWDKGVDRICYGAPHIIVAHAREDLAGVQTSCTIALNYLELAAFSAGLGTCQAGFFNAAANCYAPMTKALGLPAGHQCFGAILVGYPQYQYHRIPLRKKPVITWR